MFALAQIDFAHAGVGGDLGRRTFGKNRTADQNDDVRGEAKDHMHVVFDEQQRQISGQIRHGFENLAALLLWYAGRRLVEQQHLRTGGQGQRNFQQTLAPIGQFARDLVAVIAQLQLAQDFIGLVDRLAVGTNAAPELAGKIAPFCHGERHSFERIETGEQRVDLECPRETAPHPLLRAERGNVFAFEQYLSGIGRQHARHQVDERRFARAIRADQRVTCTGRQIDCDVARDGKRAECLR